MTDEALVPVEVVESRILKARGLKVMLDPDLAELYGVETRALVQAMKRNPNGFLGMLVSFLFVVWVALFLVGLPYFFKTSQSNALMAALGMAVGTAKAGQRLAYRSAKGFLA